MLLFWFPFFFCQIQKRMPLLMVQLMSILVLIWMVFMIISDIFHGRIALNLMFLLLLLYFVSESKLKLMYISLIVSIKSSLFHLHDFSAIQAMSWDKSDCLQSREHSFTFKYSNQALAEWYSVLHGNSPTLKYWPHPFLPSPPPKKKLFYNLKYILAISRAQLVGLNLIKII